MGQIKFKGDLKVFYYESLEPSFKFLTVEEKLNLIEQSNSIWYNILFYNDAKGEYTLSQDKISKYDIASFYKLSLNLILI